MSTSAPSMAGLSPEQKRALLARLLQEKKAQATSYPLSFAQQRLWFLEQLTPGLTAYNVPAALHLRGPLDVAALERSLSAIVRRHHSLRTVFALGPDGEPLQRISPAAALPLPLVDLTGWPEPERTAEAQRLARAEAQRPFDLQRGPLVRAALLRLASEEHVLLLTVHHIVFDEWSRGVLLQELRTLYPAYVQPAPDGQAQPEVLLPPLPVQYADFAVWQRERLAPGETLAAQLDYWRQQFPTAPAVLELPTDRPRPAEQTFSGAEYQFALSQPLTAAIRTLSQREGVTLFMTLLAAYQVLLHRYSGQRTIVVGAPITGRTRTELEPLIGFFLNTLVLPTDLGGNPSFRALLGRVRETALGAYAHQDLPFEKLVEELQLQRDLSHAPLFQVMFNLRNLSADALSLPGLEASWWGESEVSAKVDLTLLMADGADRLLGALEYNRDLFDPGTIARMAEQLTILLQGIVADPDRPILELPLLTPAERSLIAAQNATATAYPDRAGLHQLLEAQAALTPDAPAVRFGEQTLRYGELNARANQLAQHLRRCGVRAETLVGVCMERSAELVVALLAVLKAGGAYVPLDPAFPPDRLRLMLDASAMPLVLTERQVQETLLDALVEPQPGRHVPHMVRLDADWPQIAAEPTANLDLPLTPTQLAYVIFTSGSTGRPKGVQIQHQAVVNFLHSMRAQPGLSAQDVLLSVTTLSFDIAALEIFLPLSTGAQLVLVPRTVAADGVALAAALESSGATVMQATPATWRMLLDADWPGRAQLRMLCGGEALPRELAERLRPRGAALWNMYGPTETTIWSALSPIELDGSTPALGRPIANTQLYLLSPALCPVPVGVAGELYIGGDGLARGYLAQPALTAERFVPDPFSDQPGARLYRTGDLARLRADGTIEFLGRIDHQVKVRGFRIELGEIETVLRQHPAVHETVVVAREDEPGLAYLAAYIVAKEPRAENQEPRTENREQSAENQHSGSEFAPGAAALGAQELRSFIKARLPEYMVPSAFVTLAAFPLTPNGKIDRKALPAPDAGARLSTGQQQIAPRTELERQLHTIWAGLLGRDSFGVTDDFFALGGHSLLAVRLMAQIQTQLGRALPLTALFQGATIVHLAALLDPEAVAAEPAAWSPLVAIQPHGARRPFFGVHPIGGQVLCYADLARALGPDQPFYGLQAAELAELREHDLTIEQMAAQYVAALRAVQPDGPYQLGGWSFGGLVAFEMAQQLRAQGHTVGLLVLLDTFSTTALGDSEQLTDAMVLTVIAKEQALAEGKPLPIDTAALQRLDPEAQLATVLDEIRRAGLDLTTDLGWVRRLLSGYRARSRAMRAYRPQRYDGPITLFRSAQREAETARVQALMGLDLSDATYGWAAFATQPVEVYTVPGYHNTLVLGANAEQVARQLELSLARVAVTAER